MKITIGVRSAVHNILIIFSLIVSERFSDINSIHFWHLCISLLKEKNEEYTIAAEAYLKYFYCNGIISIEQKGKSQHICESIIFDKESGEGEPNTIYYRR